jgi:two-component system, cell cycle sensor histidine kinase and response regulator CckA
VAGLGRKGLISSSQRLGEKEITLPLELAAKLSDSRALFEAIAERALIGLFVVDRGGRFQFVSGRAASMTGYSVAELLALDSCLLLLSPADRPPIERVLTGQTREGRCLSTFRRSDGRLLSLEIEMACVTLSDGPRIVGVVRLDKEDTEDLGERRFVLRRGQDQEQYFRALTEKLSDIITIVDADGVVQYESPSLKAILNYEPAELVGASVFDRVHVEDIPHVRAAFERCLSTGDIQSAELRVRHKDGSWLMMEAVATNLVDDPQVRGIVLNTREISERKQLEQKLEQSSRLSSIGRLAAQMAHEFNNVLMGIQPFIGVIRKKMAHDPQILRFADLMNGSIDRGRRITHDILRFTRPSPPALMVFEVSELLATIGQELRPLLDDRISLEIEKPSDPIYIEADRMQLAQAMVNLGLNARDAMAAHGGILRIRATTGKSHAIYRFGSVPTADRFVHIELIDTGEGIDAENLKHIFEPLFTSKKAGNGLGLAIAHQIVMRHGGHIFADSEVGRGTSFHVFVPGAVVDPHVGVITAGPKETRHPGHGLRVLLVEDEPAIAAGITSSLESEGMTVRVLDRGKLVVQSVDDFKPDIIILDISLPDIDGREVFDSVRARWPSMPIVFSTGHATEADLEDHLRKPHVGFLLKPYSTADLLAAMAGLVVGAS